jgi:membrane-associated phospholipid phosphatase
VNHALFLALNNIRSPALDLFMNLGTRLGNFSNIVWLVVLALVAYPASRAVRGPLGPRIRLQIIELLPTLLIGFAVTAVLVASLKYGVRELRPGAVYGPQVVHSLQAEDSPYSFPSGHSAFAMLVVATFWRHTRGKAQLALAGYALWVGLSRINLGMHFPLDVLCGWGIGALGAWTAHTAMRQLHESRWLLR